MIPQYIKIELKKLGLKGLTGYLSSCNHYTVRNDNGSVLCVFKKIKNRWTLTDRYKHLSKVSASISN